MYHVCDTTDGFVCICNEENLGLFFIAVNDSWKQRHH